MTKKIAIPVALGFLISTCTAYFCLRNTHQEPSQPESVSIEKKSKVVSDSQLPISCANFESASEHRNDPPSLAQTQTSDFSAYHTNGPTSAPGVTPSKANSGRQSSKSATSAISTASVPSDPPAVPTRSVGVRGPSISGFASIASSTDMPLASANTPIEVPSSAVVPAALAEPGDGSALDPVSQQEVNGMANAFIDSVEQQSSSGTSKQQAWKNAQIAADDAFRARYGWDAFIKESFRANAPTTPP